MSEQDARCLKYGRGIWNELQTILDFGYAPDRVFEDWLDLSLAAHLSLTDNYARKGIHPGKLDGPYEVRYETIIAHYAEPIVDGAFVAAYERLSDVIRTRKADALGEIYQRMFTQRQHDQCFTSAGVTRSLADLSRKRIAQPRILDPSCGSGRMLIDAGKIHPDAELWGIDIDLVCAKMCALNMVIFGFNAVVIHGDSLANRYRRLWRTSGGFVSETEILSEPNGPADSGATPEASGGTAGAILEVRTRCRLRRP